MVEKNLIVACANICYWFIYVICSWSLHGLSISFSSVNVRLGQRTLRVWPSGIESMAI